MKRKKDPEEFERLLREGEPVIYAVLSELYYYPPHMKEDLIQEGFCGLIEAAERYDPKKGKFRNYAKPKIKGKMLNLLMREKKESEKKRLWRSPTFKSFSPLKIEVFASLDEREQRVLSSLLSGRTQKEIAEEMRLSQQTISVILSGIRKKFFA